MLIGIVGRIGVLSIGGVTGLRLAGGRGGRCRESGDLRKYASLYLRMRRNLTISFDEQFVAWMDGARGKVSRGQFIEIMFGRTLAIRGGLIWHRSRVRPRSCRRRTIAQRGRPRMAIGHLANA